jgi:hypothetical protein
MGERPAVKAVNEARKAGLDTFMAMRRGGGNR